MVSEKTFRNLHAMSGLARQLRSGRRASAKRVLPSHTYRLQFVMGCVLVSLWSLFYLLRIDVWMSRHCQHRSTARTCAIFAYLLLACSECHELFNHEASQSNYSAWLSAAGDKAECLYSTFADVKMLQFNSS
jgi:hypothetical protein